MTVDRGRLGPDAERAMERHLNPHIRCAAGHPTTTEFRRTWTGFKTIVCPTCERAAFINQFNAGRTT